MNRRLRGLLYTVPGLVLGALGASNCGTAAHDHPPEDQATWADPTCSFVCPAEGVADGYASISGAPMLDGFFRSVIEFQAAADVVTAGIQAELDAIGASVGARAGDTADIRAKLTAKLAENVSGSLAITHEPASCRVNTKRILDAQLKCAGDAAWPYDSVTCEGSCIVDATRTFNCGAHARLSCKGPAPGFVCGGACKGECTLKATSKCDGICRGTCAGNCSVKNAAGDCAGSCDGTCKGSCQLDAAAPCEGACKGECAYPLADGPCDAAVEARCDADPAVPVNCSRSCSGNAIPHAVNGACDETARVSASVHATCTPPPLNVSYQLLDRVAADPAASGAFQAWLEGCKRHVSTILAYEAKIHELTSAATEVRQNGEGAVKSSFDALVHAETNGMRVFGLGCGFTEVPKAVTVVGKVAADLAATEQAALDALGSITLF